MTTNDDYVEVRECDYKDEHYSVRDNGAIMRHPKGTRKRPKDNTWTFGNKTDDGYMVFCGARVHIIVATAFLGDSPKPGMVVDHIDTNRCNNRPTNLRWLTKLENILLNEYTRSKVEYICGSIENFLNNPQLLFGHESEDSNFTWMRTVTKEEAQNTLAHLDQLKARKRPMVELPNGVRMSEWVYESIQQKKRESLAIAMAPRTSRTEPSDGFYEGPIHNEPEPEPEPQPFPTARPLAFQLGWKPYTTPDFPCCPNEVSDAPLQDYLNNLEKGKVVISTNYGESLVHEFTICNDELLIVTHIPGGLKEWGMLSVEWDGQRYIHYSRRTYFDENGALAAYTRAQGKEWDGPDSIDNYC